MDKLKGHAFRLKYIYIYAVFSGRSVPEAALIYGLYVLAFAVLGDNGIYRPALAVKSYILVPCCAAVGVEYIRSIRRGL